MVLADPANGCIEFIKGVRRQRPNLIVGVRCDRNLVDGRTVAFFAQSRLSGADLGLEHGRDSCLVLPQTRLCCGRSAMYSLLERSKPAPSLGGVSGVGALEGWFKTAKHR